ncbi:hypothetical protein PTSG_11845 [Salpingoeca rosetta]|uniref:PROP1-like PPR domain-containing protein n=1 Tax=Salpingoeca rosetta (strain ATCC 50818 / BSB-021) TaxID=946362 RepID=F2U1E7_SALR5|nr:uncharacterized protein PTSG_11845 [Salpingoeca rosetta]EGD81449.1 hypothetical protein PTSG_11845 [Salpingoeca rosetta]|eukprot:XP_004996653.1 hypothetical protein PTSG_11845 [Salpingoeca rosetta]
MLTSMPLPVGSQCNSDYPLQDHHHHRLYPQHQAPTIQQHQHNHATNKQRLSQGTFFNTHADDALSRSHLSSTKGAGTIGHSNSSAPGAETPFSAAARLALLQDVETTSAQHEDDTSTSQQNRRHRNAKQRWQHQHQQHQQGFRCTSRAEMQQHAEAALRLFAVTETPAAVASTLQAMETAGIALDEEHVHQLVRCYAFAGDTERVHATLRVLAAGHHSPSPALWTTVMSAYEPPITNEKLIALGQTLDLFLFPEAQSASLAAGDEGIPYSSPRGSSGSGALVGSIDDIGVLRDQVDPAHLLQQPLLSRYILKHAHARLPSAPPVELWDQVVWCYALCKELSAARALLQTMRQAGVEPTMDTHAFVMMAHGRAYEADMALAMFDSLQRQHTRLSLSVYLCIMDALAQTAQPQEARAVFDTMVRSGIAPTTTAYNKLVKAYAHSRSPELAARVVDTMRGDGLLPNETTYRCWMYGYARTRDPAGAEALLHEMQLHGMQPCAQTFNILVYCYAMAGEVGTARAVIDRMIECGERPLTVSFNVLANAYGRQHNLDALRALVTDMAEANVAPNLVTYNTLIKSFCMNHQVDKAEATVGRMIESGLAGDLSTWGALAGAYARKGHIDSLLLTFRRCIAGGCLPNKQMFDMVVFLLSRASVPEAERLHTITTIAHMIVDAAQDDPDANRALIQHCLHSVTAS